MEYPPNVVTISYDTFLSPTGRQLHESAIRRMGTVVAGAGDIISFAAGYPDPAGFPWTELRELTTELLTGEDPGVLQYGPTRGYAPLIDTVVEMLRERHIAARREEIIVTSGSQQGLDLVGRVLVTPGDVVLVELPAYTGAISAFKNAGAQLAGVAQGADGIDIDDLDAVLCRERGHGKRVNLLYVVPNFQNPTGVLLGREKRQQLLAWAERRDILLIEDDPYGALFFDEPGVAPHTRPLRADDLEGRVIYLSTFSKTLAPAFRVGWMVAPAALIERFDTAKQSIDLTTGILDQRIVHEAAVRGVLDRIAPSLRQLYRGRRDATERAIREALGDRVSWLQPRGGFFLWLRLPEGIEDDELLCKALERHVVFVAGSAFYVNGKGHDRIRLSFSAPPVEAIHEGIRRLAAAIELIGGAAGR